MEIQSLDLRLEDRQVFRDRKYARSESPEKESSDMVSPEMQSQDKNLELKENKLNQDLVLQWEDLLKILFFTSG